MSRSRAVRVLSSERAWTGTVFSVLRQRLVLPSGMAQDVAIVEHPGAVAVAALDEQGRLTLVRQYRPAAGDWLTEIPAGRLEPPESPLEAAQRELEEETGLSAAHWSLLREFFPAPGFCSERVYLFLARQLSSVGPNRRPPDPDEELEILHMAPSEVLASSIRDAKTLLAAALLE